MVALRMKISAAVAFAITVVTIADVCAQQPQARMAGLERNEDYMALLRQDVELVHRIDSLTTAVYDLREILYSDDSKRKERSAELLKLESDLYMLRDDRSRLVDRINAIEQEWLLANISAGSAPQEENPAPAEPAAAEKQRADLVKNSYFSRSLSRNDYATLCRAQNDEVVASHLYSDFVKSYSELADMRTLYDSLTVESEADSVYSLLQSKQIRLATISDSLSTVWNTAFDNKSYLYDLLFDKAGRDDMLDKAEQKLFTMRQGVARANGLYASDAVVEYLFGKRFIVDYEIDIAGTAGLAAAADSLAKVRSSLDGLRFDFEKIPTRKRSFIDYAPVVFSSRYVYNSGNPVPECPVYEYGVVYRIKLGEFTSQQPAAKFKGIEPVNYLRTATGGWVYYAGCYRTLDEMEKALNALKRLGFAKADVAVWNDGVYAGSREAVEALMSKRYSIEITGVDELSEEVREVIDADEDNSGVVRTGRGVFTVGGLSSREAADALAAAISAADSSLTVRVVELSSEE